MEVKLIVVSGKRAGKEVPVAGPKFLIGRAEDCQLRPHSELVSRHHCVILVEKAFVTVRDFGSKNGTLVNDEPVRGERELKNGDRIKVGDLEFEVRLGVTIGGKKKPKVHSVQEAAARTVESSLDEDMDLDRWLNDTDTQAFESTRTDVGTETATVPAPAEEPPLPEEPAEKKPKKIKVVGVWQKAGQKPTAVNPRDAAAETLRNLFQNRRQ